MSYHYVDDYGQTLGFSLKPPKWLRKAAKALIPIAAIGATLLIPGVGGAIVGAAAAAGKAVAGAAGAAAKGAAGLFTSPAAAATLKSLAPAPTTGTMQFPNLSLPPGALPAPTAVARPVVAKPTDLTVPLLIGAGVLLLLSTHDRRN